MLTLDLAPETHDFSFSFTPTRFLLFNYSALTHNAHLIHYDKDYALNVEGHRNLLVHGPLTLTLLLQAMANFLAKKEGEKHVILSIDYRNMAPLYCDEEMKICGSFKKTIVDESTYEIWIEGPTGGMAVKGIVHTKKLDKGMPELDETAKPYTAAEFNALPIRRVTAPPARKDSARDAPEVKPLKIKKLTSLHIRTTWDAEFRGPRRRRAKGNSDGQPEGQPDGQPDGKADVDSS